MILKTNVYSKDFCDDFYFIIDKVDHGPRTYKQAKKRKPSKNKRSSKPKTYIQKDKKNSYCEKLIFILY